MALSVKDPETDRLAREQRRRGKTIDQGKIDEIVRRIAALPVVDDRSPDELIGYNDM